MVMSESAQFSASVLKLIKGHTKSDIQGFKYLDPLLEVMS